MAATLGATYSPPPPLELHYSDTTSSIYPDRPIRPLPKKRLRSRLSSEVADSILYPPATTLSKPLFQFPYNGPTDQQNGLPARAHLSEMDANLVREQRNGDGEIDSYQFRGAENGSDDEDGVGMARRCQEQRQRPGSVNNMFRSGYTLSRSDTVKYIKPPIPQSTASSGDSVDGYDSFENTNNKKKRKIPTSGSLGSHQTSLSADMAQMGISSTRDIDVAQSESDSGVGHYYGTGNSAVSAISSGTGISGAGRGRYGRAGTRYHSGRSPLGVSVNGSNTLQAGRSFQHRRDYTLGSNTGGKEAAAAKSTDQGIISAAIAEAAASPTTPVKGQENKSLLEQQSSKNSSSAKTQFTFICESDSAKSMVWPPDIDFSPSPSGPYSRVATNSTGPHQSQNGRGFATQGTQTSPNMASQTNQAAAHQTGANQQAPQQTKKPRRPLHKQYALAARNRRTRQEMNNYKNPPKEEDVWICEFCEYESIFHEPPKALIRQYEAKDRLERKRLAEKQRLLEKAKMKGRKGKKGNKKNANAATHAQPPAQKSRYGQQPVDEILVQHQGTQSEEYVLDDYDDDPIPMPALPTQTPSKIPQPVSQNYNQSLRPSSSSGGVKGNIGADRKAYS